MMDNDTGLGRGFAAERRAVARFNHSYCLSHVRGILPNARGFIAGLRIGKRHEHDGVTLLGGGFAGVKRPGAAGRGVDGGRKLGTELGIEPTRMSVVLL